MEKLHSIEDFERFLTKHGKYTKKQILRHFIDAESPSRWFQSLQDEVMVLAMQKGLTIQIGANPFWAKMLKAEV